MNMEIPVIGAVYYKPRSPYTPTQILCDVCYGVLSVQVILGNGETVQVPCGACAPGLGSPTGYRSEYVATVGADRFKIAELTSMHSGEWYVKSTLGLTSSMNELHLTEEAALQVSAKQVADLAENNQRSRAANKTHKLEKMPWTVQYHESCIREAERSIAWHRRQVSERKPSKASKLQSK